MSRAPAPRSAVNASLWFILGRSLGDVSPPPAEAQSVSSEVSEVVAQLLEDQGSAELTPQVLETIQAGLYALDKDPSLSLSASRYDSLRRDFISGHGVQSGKGRALWPLGSTTILKRASGSWSQALAEAGLAVSTGPRPTGFGQARFSPEQFSTALQDFAAHALRAGEARSYQNYLAWRKAQLEQGRTDLPSGPAIRNSFGGWSTALKQAGAHA